MVGKYYLPITPILVTERPHPGQPIAISNPDRNPNLNDKTPNLNPLHLDRNLLIQDQKKRKAQKDAQGPGTKHTAKVGLGLRGVNTNPNIILFGGLPNDTVEGPVAAYFEYDICQKVI